MYKIKVLPNGCVLHADGGETLLSLLRRGAILSDAPCGGQGTCGKCRVIVDGEEVLSCVTVVDRDMTVTIPKREAIQVLAERSVSGGQANSSEEGFLLAVDIGTTTLAGCLLDGRSEKVLAAKGMLNPQTAYGADVISRIRYEKEHPGELTGVIRSAVNELATLLCAETEAEAAEIRTVSIVGNPAMQQLFMGLGTKNLSEIPFAPVITRAMEAEAAIYLNTCGNAKLRIVPNVSGFLGSDIIGGILATGMDRSSELILLVDIGTNGEMVLGNCERLAACSTAAGPALEGANIQCGMRAKKGAIDHVRWENDSFCCSVIGGGEAEGICGSGLIDAVAAAMDAGLLNARGRILNEDRVLRLSEKVILTQEDIRQVQLAKGAVAAGVELLARQLGVSLSDIDRVYLAGAFGAYLDGASACRMGLLPSALAGKITAAGNAALEGAKMLAWDRVQLDRAQMLTKKVELVELAEHSEFPRAFARNMRF